MLLQRSDLFVLPDLLFYNGLVLVRCKTGNSSLVISTLMLAAEANCDLLSITLTDSLVGDLVTLL